MSKKINHLTLAGLSLLSFVVGLTVPPAHSQLSVEMAKFRQTYELVVQGFYKPVDHEKVMQGAIRGMLDKLEDPYSNYLNPAEFKQLEAEKSGAFTGIGIEIGVRNDELTIISALADTPASRGGLRSGDIIRQIDGKDTLDLSYTQSSNLLLGQAGTEVKLNIARPDQRKNFEVTLKRAVLNLKAVSFEKLDSGHGYIKLSNFLNSNAADQVKLALEKLQAENINGLILDLRDNPGGLVSMARDIGGFFIEQGVIVRVVNRFNQENTIQSSGKPILPQNTPMVVLINQGSASASEILAASLKEHQRATLIGEKSFGKGLIQAILPLDDGSGLSLSTSKYLTSQNKEVHGKGIQPDIKIPNPNSGEKDTQLEAAIKFLNR